MLIRAVLASVCVVLAFMAVSNELSGRKIDIVLYDENLARYVTNAMEPAEVSRIVINEDAHVISIAVAEGELYSYRSQWSELCV